MSREGERKGERDRKGWRKEREGDEDREPGQG
jgi:hypothetical protein